jgi:hypothetical protein
MPVRPVPALILAGAVVFSAGFFVGRLALPAPVPVIVEVHRFAGQDAVTLSRSGDWIRVFRGDALTAEWQRKDGAVYAVLDLVIAGEWALLPEPAPAPSASLPRV